jgi:hypothetical protein
VTIQQTYIIEKMSKIHEIKIDIGIKKNIYAYSINKKARKVLCYEIYSNGKTKLLSQKVLTKN